MVVRTRLYVTLCVHWLYCWFIFYLRSWRPLIYSFFPALSIICGKRLLASSGLTLSLTLRLPTRMEHIGFHCTNFHEIWYFFRKYVEKYFPLISDKSDKNFTWSKFVIISGSVVLRMRNVSGKICREIQIFMKSDIFFENMSRTWPINTWQVSQALYMMSNVHLW